MVAWIVEPSAFVLKLLSRLVSSLGFTQKSFSSGLGMLKALDEEQPQLILASLISQDLTAPVIFRQLRTRIPLNPPVMVMLTSSGDPEVAKEASESGADGVFYKSDLGKLRDFLGEMFPGVVIDTPRKPRILYVEDSAVIQKMVGRYLQQESWEVITATSAEAALEILKNETLDLILSDVHLGTGMTGLDLLKVIRSFPGGGPPFLLVTGMEDQAQIAELYRQGADDVVLKPVLKEEVLARIKIHLKIRELEARLITLEGARL